MVEYATDSFVTDDECAQVANSYRSVLQQVEQYAAAAANGRTKSQKTTSVRLVAVSKTNLWQAVYDRADCRTFGDSYVQELVQKVAQFQYDAQRPVSWHYIGALQGNKCNALVQAVYPHVAAGSVAQFVVEL